MEEIISHVYQIEEDRNFRNTGKNCIHLWTFNRQSEVLRLRIQNFYNFVHVELPNFVDGRHIKWDDSLAYLFMENLNAKLKDDKPVEWKLVFKDKIYYDKGNVKYPMLILYFDSYDAIRHCLNLIKKPQRYGSIGTMILKMHENNISIIRKLFTVRKTKYAQWFKIKGVEIPTDSDERLSVNSVKEYIVEWKTIEAIPLSETVSWRTYPKILAIDIETYSDNHKHLPDAFNPLHKAYMISCIYQKLGDKSTRKKYGILLGACNHIEGVEIIKISEEYEIVDELAKLILKLDPDIISGYNIFSYDYPYLDTRRKSQAMLDWPVMGRTIGKISEPKTKSWKSSAYGHNEICIIDMDGRISIDMLPIVRRDYKLEQYTLDFVCKEFLGKGKHDIKADEMFKIYENVDKQIEKYPDIDKLEIYEKIRDTQEVKDMTRVMEYCIQDSELVIDLFEKMKVWIGLCELANVVGVTLVELFTRGQQIRCLSQIYDIAYNLNIVVDQIVTIKTTFNGGFVYEPIPGVYNNILCLDFASLYPSIMRAFNICYTTLVHSEFSPEIPDSECHIIKFSQEEPISGVVPPVNINNDDENDVPDGLEEEDIDDEDIEKDADMIDGNENKKTVMREYVIKWRKAEYKKGIIPIIEENLVNERSSVRKIIKNNEIDIKILYIKIICLDNNQENINKINLDRDIIVRILNNKVTNDDRKNIEKEIEKDDLIGICKKIQGYIEQFNEILELEIQNIVLDKRQNALKVSANSLFGFFGVQNGGLLPLIEAAMSITAKGRELINEVNDYVKTKYNAKIVYNDTDSSMIDLNIQNSKDCEYWGNKLVDEISKLFPPPLRMEFEKAMRLLCLRKKKYAAYLIKKDGEFEKNKDGSFKILKRGIVLARRDNPNYLRKSYTELLKLILDDKPIKEGFDCVIKCTCDLIGGRIPVKDNLTIVRELGANYKSASYFLKVYSDELRRSGKPVNAGDRVVYVIVKSLYEIAHPGEKILTGKKMRSIETWIEDSNTKNREEIDYMYYLEKIICNPIDQLFSIGYMKDIKILSEYVGYESRHSRCNRISISNIIKLLCRMINDYILDGYNLNQIAYYIEDNLPKYFKEMTDLHL